MKIKVITQPGDGFGSRDRQLEYDYVIPSVEEAELYCRPPEFEHSPDGFAELARYQKAQERQRRLIDCIATDIARSLANSFDQEYTR